MNDSHTTEASRVRWVRPAMAAGALAFALLWTWRERTKPAPHAANPAPASPLPSRLAPETLSRAEAEREVRVVSGYSRQVERPKPVLTSAARGDGDDGSTDADRSPAPEARHREPKAPLPEALRMPGDAPVPKAAPTPTPSPGLAEFAPFGRLIRCELVGAVDSVTARTEPIVALVTHDLCWNGSVTVPAGSEAFGYAKPEAVMDTAGTGRLVDTGEWTLVLPGAPGTDLNGRELVLRARAIDRSETRVDETGEPQRWGPLDGADGLVGSAVRTMDDRELKLFAAAAISGMSQGMAAVLERQQAAPGLSGALGATQAAPTLGNAAIGSAATGAVEVANEYAGRIRDELRAHGVYVRVPAGKPFYLFVEQTINPAAARAGLRLPAGRAGS